MKKGFKLLLVKGLLFVVLVFIGFVILYRIGYPPIVTDSVLFDKKMFEVQKRGIKDVKIMAIGGSITLYAFNSEMIVRKFHEPYYNFSSWRLQISDLRQLAKTFVREHHPRYVMFGSSIGDFRWERDSTYLNFLNMPAVVRNNFPEIFYFQHYNSICQMFIRKWTNHHVDLDQWGGMPMTIAPKDRDTAAWNQRWEFPTAHTAEQYRELDSMAVFFRDQHIQFIFVQAPIRAAYANTPAVNQLLAAHFDTCRSIVEGDGGIYLNYYNTTIFTDSLFIDQYHLQAAGGKIMTKELLADLATIIK